MNEAELIATPDARIISPAAIPDRAAWPRKSLILALALALGCGLGGSLALTAEHLDRRIYTGSQLLAATGLNSLASIPSLRTDRGLIAGLLGRRARNANFYDMVMEILEGATEFRAAVFRLVTRLVNFETFGHPRVVLLTSSVSGEGKSALALSLAVAGASTGMRILLVDASLADPTLTELIGEPAPGSKLAHRIISDQRLGLSFLSLAGSEPQGSGKSGRAALGEELGQIASGFDLTVVDCGLLRSERNAPALISIAQAILFLARAASTSQNAAAAAAADLLQMASGRRCAAVLTMTPESLEQ